MLRLIVDGPGWTDATLFYKYNDNGKVILIGVTDNTQEIYKFVGQSFEEAVSELTSVSEWDDEDNGTHTYVEGDTPEDFDPNNWEDLDDFEYAEEYDSVGDYLNDLGYNGGEDLYFRDEAEDYLREHDIDVDDEDVSDLLDEVGYYNEGYADYMFNKEDLDNIINQLKR